MPFEKFQNGRLMLSLQENEFKKNPKIYKIKKPKNFHNFKNQKF